MMQRRDALLMMAVLAGLAGQAYAQALGSEGFRIIAPFPPGGPVDSLARILAAGLTERYKQSAVVENLAGAAGNIGIEKVKQAKPDGHTLLVVPAGNLTINPTLMPNFPFNIERDFVPVTTLAEQGISGVVVTSWYGLLAPAGTPAATAERLAKDAAEILGQPAMREQLKAQGLTETLMKPAEFATYIRSETVQWAKIIKARNIVAE